MTAKLSVCEQYTIPESPFTGKFGLFDICRSGSAMPEGRPGWFRVGVFHKPTQLPDSSIGDGKAMMNSPFKAGWLFTNAPKKNELFEAMRDGLLGPSLELALPNLNIVAGSVLHTIVDAAFERYDNARLLRAALAELIPVAYANTSL